MKIILFYYNMAKCYNKANNKWCYFCCWNSLNNIFYHMYKNISNTIIYGTKRYSSKINSKE